MKKYLPFVSFWLLNSLLLYLAAMFLPQYFELGTATVPETKAIFWSGLLLTTIVWLSKPVADGLGLKLEGNTKMFLYYWLVNSSAIWILARVAEYSGLGISAFYWAIVFGVFANLGQWIIWQVLKSYNLIGSTDKG